MRIVAFCCLILLTVSACNRNRGFSDGPDEFGVLPARPLSKPASFSALPPPSAAAGNLADQTPRADAIRALGG